MDKRDLARTFETRWRQLGGPPLEQEVRIVPGRKFAADYVHLASGVAIELEGGVWTNGRHTRPLGYTSDCEKYNLAQLAGFRVFRFTRQMLDKDPAGCLGPVIKFIRESL